MAKSKKKRKIVSPLNGALQKATRQILAKNNTQLGLISVRNTVQPSYMPYVVKGLYKNIDWGEKINSNPFPQSYNEIKTAKRWPYQDLKRDVLWIASSVAVYHEEINKFVVLKSEYEKFMLESDFNSANEILTRIDSLFGKSLWLIENKLLLIDKKEGAEKQRALTKEITDDPQNNYFVQILSYFFSMRVDPNYSAARLSNLVNDVCVDSGIRELEKSYIKFHLFPFSRIEYHDIGEVINTDINSPVIDKYLALSNFIKLIFSWPEYEKMRPSLYLTLQEMSCWAPDITIQNLASILQLNKKEMLLHQDAEEVLSAFDYYTEGKYKESLAAFDSILTLNPDFVELYEAKVKAANYAESGLVQDIKKMSLQNEICNLMHQVLLKSPSFDVAINKLLKHALSHASHSWSSHILSFLKRDGRKRWQEDMDGYTIQSAISSRVFNPWQDNVFSLYGQNSQLLDMFSELCPNSITLELQKIHLLSMEEFEKRIKKIGIPEHRRQKYTCFKLISEKKYKEAITILKPFISSKERGVDYYDALRYITDCYRLAKKINECSDLIVRAYLENNFVCSFLAIPELIDLIKKDSIHTASKEITWPILNEIHYRHFSGASEDARLEAYQDFLEENDYFIPSQLNLGKIPKVFLVFFFRYVCSLNVLENSVAFSSSEEMFQERMKIYQILGQLDPDNEQEYISETASLAEKISIRKLSRQVEQSKIYVDVDGIKSKLEKEFLDKYERFILLINNPKLDVWTDNFVQTLLEQLQNSDRGLQHLVLPPRESDYILSNLLADLTEQFVTSTDFGLDFYISTRIRHGTLSGQLRSSLEGLNLLTTKDVKGENYKDNEHWAEKLHRLDDVKQKNIQKLLKSFSSTFDNLIERLTQEWFQVKLTERQLGLFDYSKPHILQKFVSSQIDYNGTTYEQFLDIVFEGLWNITEEKLSTIRTRLKTEFEPQVIELLNDLKNNARQLMGEYFDDQGFSSTMTTAITDFQTAVDRVVEWCRISKSKDTPDTPVRTAVAVGLQSINSYYPKHQLEPKIEINPESGLIIKGEWLSYFTDIFLILFHNVKVHSKIEGRSPEMRIDISKEKDIIRMVFSNEISSIVNQAETEKRLKKALEDTPLTEIVQKEGGSGLLKLKKILKMDLKCNPETSAHITDGYLYIDLRIQGKNILI